MICKRKLSVIISLIMAVFAFSLYLKPCMARPERRCVASFCGNLNISWPFGLTSRPRGCGGMFQVSCHDNQTILTIKHGKFYVREISYVNQTARLVDATLESDKCSIPRSSLSNQPNLFTVGYVAYLLACRQPVNSPLYIDATPCSNMSTSSSSSSTANGTYLYLLDGGTPLKLFHESCTVDAQIRLPSKLQNITGMNVSEIYQSLLRGFQVWFVSDADVHSWTLQFRDGWVVLGTALTYYPFFLLDLIQKGFHGAKDYVFLPLYYAITGMILVRFLLGILLLAALITSKLRRRHLSVDDTIEEFLQSQNNLMPIRYSYSEIKKMTRGFKEKLGQGGYGLVFKGKLQSGHLVAIKLLRKSKGNGQDFINEVATIGRIHHVNVAKLIGFCVEGSKQALVYDFMSNGSLDKIIFDRENRICLSWKQMLEIVLGVARGIEYLHQGCDMHILHFDIKPHNILLDEKYVPKISDFGLAKQYPIDNSIVSLTAARGTLGYIAPELFYKNLGGISYKADVYSFGMLLMEMVGKRKNLSASIEQSSQIYFPSWIYNQFDCGEEMDLDNVTNDEKKIVKKMIITAFWCIQMKPDNRPSMSKVLEMLQTEVDFLTMPTRHSLFFLEMS